MAVPSEDEAKDQAFIDIVASISQDVPKFTEREDLVLSLYDQLHELRLEHALLEAQQASSSPPPDTTTTTTTEASEASIKAAERQYLEARATYMLHKSIAENVMISDPTLKAVHSAPTANPAEMALHPYLDSRDLLAMVDARLFDSLTSAVHATAAAEAKLATSRRKNYELIDTVAELCGKIDGLNAAAAEDPTYAEQLRAARASTKVAKGRWRMMKSVVGAMVAGSGVNWASDPVLLEVVMDEED